MADVEPVVHVVDDDESFLKAVARLLRAEGFAVKKYASAADFLSRTEHAPGCVLVDLRMPAMSGLDLQAELAGSDDPLPVVFLTAHADVPATVRAMKQGAEDFLGKGVPKADLIGAVRRALSRDAAERSTREHQRELRERFALLTPRERAVLTLVFEGKLNKEIAVDLGIHERTVKLHRTAITTKLGVPSVAQLMRLAQEAGILP